MVKIWQMIGRAASGLNKEIGVYIIFAPQRSTTPLFAMSCAVAKNLGGTSAIQRSAQIDDLTILVVRRTGRFLRFLIMMPFMAILMEDNTRRVPWKYF
jgi:hypothetical protein